MNSFRKPSSKNSAARNSEPVVTLNFGHFSISKAACEIYKSLGKNCMVTFRAHCEQLTGEPLGEVQAANFEQFIEDGVFRSEHSLTENCRVCVLTDNRGKWQTILMLQSEYDAGLSSELLAINPTRPMHLWGSSDTQAEG